MFFKKKLLNFYKSKKSNIFAVRKIKRTKKYNFKTKDMTKAEVVNEIAKKTGIEKTVVLSTVETFMEVIKESLTNQEPVYLRGFGSFIIKKRAEKTARDIHKETTLIIPAHNIPAFKPAKTFVQEVKNK
ncbi:MAG: integration host factor subunit beta [Bacteroidaceae bacterium]|nr:integration host factor subunit beta [Bacteroidaceae bacterium]